MSNELLRALAGWAFDEVLKRELVPMVWISGPRQVGKTRLAQRLPAGYFNWDTSEVRKAYAKDPYFFRTEKTLMVFDEIHKRRDFKKILKGYYDSPSRRENFVVTGSARMDVYRKGGDSLQGRYHSCHLLPLTPDEIHAKARSPLRPVGPRDWRTWVPAEHAPKDEDLCELGGFPEPFLKGTALFLRRWQDQYLDRLIREDSRDYAAVQRLEALDLLARLLPQRVSAPCSYLSLARDVEVSPIAIRAWLTLMETLFLGFRLYPFHYKIHRAVKKEPKWYFFQWTYVEDPAARFENYLAVQLRTACASWSQQGYGRWELYYLRDQDRREVDFVICCDLKPVALIEAKQAAQAWPSGLHYYGQRLRIPAFLVHPGGSKPSSSRIQNAGWTLPSARFLQNLMTDG